MPTFDKVLVTDQKKQEIKAETPEKMPLNPTAQGWSGPQVRKQLAKSTNMLVDELAERMTKVKEVFDDIPGHYPDHFGVDRFAVSADEPTDAGVTLWFKIQ